MRIQAPIAMNDGMDSCAGDPGTSRRRTNAIAMRAPSPAAILRHVDADPSMPSRSP